MSIRTRFLGVGAYLPPQIWTNDDLTKIMDTSDDWIQQRTGICKRHWVASNVCTSEIAAAAAEKALAVSRVNKEEIDMLILATLSPDHEFPGTACFVQKRLGIHNIPALDIRQQCTGFIYGLSIADQFIRTGMYKKILLIGAETHSKGLDISTKGREIAVLFGDGAGAAVLGACEITESEADSYVLSTHLHADGMFARELWTPAPGSAHEKVRISHENLEQGDHFPKMNGKVVFLNACRRIPEVINEALDFNNKSINEIDLFILHQANLRINEKVADTMGIPREKVFNTIEDYGNTTAATIPIGLNDAVAEGVLKPGMLVASAAFGSGFTWASALYRW